MKMSDDTLDHLAGALAYVVIISFWAVIILDVLYVVGLWAPDNMLFRFMWIVDNFVAILIIGMALQRSRSKLK